MDLIRCLEDLEAFYGFKFDFSYKQRVRLNCVFEEVFRRLSGLSKELKYHNIGHTFELKFGVLSVCYELCFGELELRNIGVNDVEIVLISAVFHDVGFLSQYFNNEEVGARMSQEILRGFGEKLEFKEFLTEANLSKVSDLILATKFPPNVDLIGKDILKQILCDADVANFGREDFYLRGKALREGFTEGIPELGLKPLDVSSSIKWYSNVLKAMRCYFFTKTAQRLYQKKKVENEQEIVQAVFRAMDMACNSTKKKEYCEFSMLDLFKMKQGFYD